MTQNTHNEGIIQYGGQINAEQVAVGHRAVAEKTIKQTGETLGNRGQADVSAALEALMTAVQQSEAQLAKAESVYEALESLAAELKKEEPNGITVKGLLSGLSEAGKTVADVVSAVAKLSAVVAPLF